MSSGVLGFVRRLRRDESGMVTVEAAYAMAAIAAFLLIGVGAVGGVSVQIRCTDAAREVARLTAAGDESARRVGAAVAPRGAGIEVHDDANQVVVVVSADVPLLPLVRVSARAVAAREPTGVE
ncbi:Flp pilus assembly pilin Flp [Gordonia hydrophobica]|nr:Flp pilus assembly pilin Flp [Gordonia hydrophobica]